MYIKVNVTAIDRPRYRMRKGEIETNVLAFCNTNGEFVFVLLVEMSTREMVAGARNTFFVPISIYLTRKFSSLTCEENEYLYLPGWEGPTIDSQVLWDAISQPKGLKVLKGK